MIKSSCKSSCCAPGLQVVLPSSLEGVRAAALLKGSNVRVALGGIYTATQALMAHATGARNCMLQLSDMIDAYGPEEAWAHVQDVHTSLQGVKSGMRVMANGIRDPDTFSRAAAEVSPKP